MEASYGGPQETALRHQKRLRTNVRMVQHSAFLDNRRRLPYNSICNAHKKISLSLRIVLSSASHRMI